MEFQRNGVFKDSLDLYDQLMKKVLPETNDDSLFYFHYECKRTAMEHFVKTGSSSREDASALDTALEDAFLDIFDLNWEKCESYCRDILNNLKFAMTASLPCLHSKSEAYQSQWWGQIKNLRKKYVDSVGERLSYQMPHVWLEYLNDRQEQDFKVLIGDILLERENLEELEDMGSGISTLPSDDEDSFQYQPLPTAEADSKTPAEPYTDFCLETTEKQLRLQMMWGRIFVYWKYWIECRKDTTDVLEQALGVIQSLEKQRNMDNNFPTHPTEATYLSIPAETVYDRIQHNPSLRHLLVHFARTTRKDFMSYKCLTQKLQDFFDMILTPDFVCTFDMNPTNIFQRISTFQTNMAVKSETESSRFRVCAKFLEKEQDSSNAVAKMFGSAARPVFHLKTFLMEAMSKTVPGDQISFTVQRFASEVSDEEKNWSAMLSESIDALLIVASNVMDSIPQLRNDIAKWMPQRDETIAQLRVIVDKLHLTTKNVAITQTVSSSVGIVGGAIAVGGLIMAPFTMGASLIPTAIAGGVVSGIGAATAIGASVTEVIIDKDQMKKATSCLQEDKTLFDAVASQIRFMNLNSTLLLRYIPQDELESFISVITNPKSKAILSVSSIPNVNPRIAINIARLLSVGGRVLITPVSRMVLAGTIATSRVAVLALAHGIAAIGIALDVANLVVAGVKLGKGARSQSAEKLEEVVTKLEEEKRIIENCLNDISLEY